MRRKIQESSKTAAGPSKDRRSSGPGRLLIAVYGVFALSATARAAFQILTKFDEAPLAYSLTAFAAAVYLLATVSLARAGRKWYRVSVAAVSVELMGVLGVGFLGVFDAAAFPNETMWSGFGSGYAYIPLILPLLGLGWLYRNRPGKG
ncbi:hypothetical protein IWX65_001722 [Arthrobacter sp. CAN_A214]|uniref:hypothetical protein n=1 Tax=Arthrobacter sp. CAN_A214 TaxID=2787720 RepID=UPI001A2A1A88